MTPPLFSPRQLRSITHEVLVVHGREDRPAAREQALCLAQHLPNAQLHMFPHAGHWVQIEQVDRFRALVEMFLTEAPSPVTRRPLSTAGRHPSGISNASLALPAKPSP
ncbi:alpha/beta fold hydrolase [Raineyella fluvialis]|uniref:Alpha/beta fold hydrolase n=1 Tax=Raineyella fluvialis TaxID=2662261 RepID=A0A5Q2F9S6_9ACTN|nr:alpha/beta hydrolase [Raineyella fluvialis]QGF23559.1 alpha/beta fold hydrolase [Raineyella fluvialis]